MMSILDFINYAKDNLEFISYCEIIILPTGGIELARPSHREAAVRIASKLEGVTVEEIKSSMSKSVDPLGYIVSKHNLIAVWYHQILYHKKINRFQRHSLKLLRDNELIAANLSGYETNE